MRAEDRCGFDYFFFRRFVVFFAAAFFAFLFFAIAALLACVWMAISVQCSRESTCTTIRLLQREKNNSDSA